MVTASLSEILHDEIKRKLRIRAAEHGCSMEAEWSAKSIAEAVEIPPTPRKGSWELASMSASRQSEEWTSEATRARTCDRTTTI